MADLQEAYKVAAYLDLKVKSLEDVVSERSNGEDVKVVFKGYDAALETLERSVRTKLLACAHVKKIKMMPQCLPTSPLATNIMPRTMHESVPILRISYRTVQQPPRAPAATNMLQETVVVVRMGFHKYMCGPDLDTRPTPTHRQAILLPETSERPILVWIDTCTEDFIEQDFSMILTEEWQQLMRSSRADPVKSNDSFTSNLARLSGDGLKILAKIDGTYPKIAGLLGDGLLGYFDTAALVGGVRGGDEHLDHSINVGYRDSMTTDGVSKPNHVLDTLGKGKVKEFWKGPLVIYGMAKSVERPTCVDLRACDLGLAIRGLARLAKEYTK
ncbi:hypothetical protein LTR22_021594 [Elasticomyces elasticus]|nr:hypothetical protein LTR22_021594 [Elasticomyces elasticus]